MVKYPVSGSDGSGDEVAAEFVILVNHEGQYSIWPSFRQLPDGWTVVGDKGDRAICLDWIERNWKDMRPRSLVAATSVAQP
jgi:MbtH protein